MSLEESVKVLEYRAKFEPRVAVVLAGGINLENIASYASLGADAVVTSAMYYHVKGDIKAKVSLI